MWAAPLVTDRVDAPGAAVHLCEVGSLFENLQARAPRRRVDVGHFTDLVDNVVPVRFRARSTLPHS